MTLENFPDWYAERNPDKAAIIMGGGKEVSYRELVERSRQLAHWLRGEGVGQDDAIAIFVDNDPRFIETMWGAQRAGIRYSPVATRLGAEEVAYILRDTEAKVLVASARLAEVAHEARKLAPGVTSGLMIDGTFEGFVDYETAIGDQPTTPVEDEAEGLDVLYSSGTTGNPKGIEVDASLAPLGTPTGMEKVIAERWNFTPETVYLSAAPMYHSTPIRFNLLTHRYGGTSVMMERFDTIRFLELVERHRITHLNVVPTMLIRVLKLPKEQREAYDLSSIEMMVTAAAPCPPQVKQEINEWLGPVLHEYYAATERNLFTAITPAEAFERPGSVGKALVGTVHILDEEGNQVEPGTTGVIWGEGGFQFKYHNDPERTAQAYNDKGWSTVGDLGYLDEDGYLYLSDRRTDMIIAGGVNIYPQEAENVLVTHPEVTDVAVFGVPHEDMGEEVKAVVQPASMDDAGPELEERLIEYCRANLALFKCPRSIDFRAELPRHQTGKLYKRLLRDEYEAAYKERAAAGSS
jgi:fatty-acyl-CoA synthase